MVILKTLFKMICYRLFVQNDKKIKNVFNKFFDRHYDILERKFSTYYFCVTFYLHVFVFWQETNFFLEPHLLFCRVIGNISLSFWQNEVIISSYCLCFRTFSYKSKLSCVFNTLINSTRLSNYYTFIPSLFDIDSVEVAAHKKYI